MANRKPYAPPAIEKTEPYVRKPYTPPAIEESGSFERLVLSCGHQPIVDEGHPDCDPSEGQGGTFSS